MSEGWFSWRVGFLHLLLYSGLWNAVLMAGKRSGPVIGND